MSSQTADIRTITNAVLATINRQVSESPQGIFERRERACRTTATLPGSVLKRRNGENAPGAIVRKPSEGGVEHWTPRAVSASPRCSPDIPPNGDRPRRTDQHVRRGCSAGERSNRPSTRLPGLPVGPGTRPTTMTITSRPPDAINGRTRLNRSNQHMSHHRSRLFRSIRHCRNALAVRCRRSPSHRPTPSPEASRGPTRRGPNRPGTGRCRRTPAVRTLGDRSPAGPNRHVRVTSSRSNRRTGNRRDTCPPETPNLHRPRRPPHRCRHVSRHRPRPSDHVPRPGSSHPRGNNICRNPLVRPPTSVPLLTPHRNGRGTLRHRLRGCRKRRDAGRPRRRTVDRVPRLVRRSPAPARRPRRRGGIPCRRNSYTRPERVRRSLRWRLHPPRRSDRTTVPSGRRTSVRSKTG